MNVARARGWLGWLLLLALLGALSACGRGGLPGSVLLTPPALRNATATYTLVPPTATPTDTATPTVTPTDTPSPTSTPTDTPTATPSDTPTQTLTHTFGPSPTNTKTPTLTRTATRTRIPTRTRVPSKTPTITYTPTITLTPTPPAPFARIVRPGPLSKVLSPLRINARLTPGDDGMIIVELVGEDSRMIARQVEDYRFYLGRSITVGPVVPFVISAAAETARLSVYTLDLSGRRIALASVDLILLSVGSYDINASPITEAPYIVRSPQRGADIFGGTLRVEGLVRPVSDQPLIIELIDEQGKIVGATQVDIAPPTPDLSHTPFTAEVPYTVEARTAVRLTLRQESSGRIPGTVWLSSLLVTLNP